jgi:hypothetical protein
MANVSLLGLSAITSVTQAQGQQRLGRLTDARAPGAKPLATATAPSLAEIMRTYRSKIPRDVLVDWSFKLWSVLPMGFSPTRITSTEAKMLDNLTLKKGSEGIKSFRNIGQDATSYGIDIGVKKSAAIGDSYRHCYWSARLTQQFGSEWAARYTTAHEGDPNTSVIGSVADLYNNNVGQQIALQNPKASPEQLKRLVDQAFANGQLVVISHGRLYWSGQALELRESQSPSGTR